MAAAMTAGLFTGCGSTESTDTDKTESTASAGSTAEESGDSDKIVVRFACLGTVPSDLETVQKAINDITIPSINVEVELESVSMSNYTNQLSMDLIAGTEVDVFCSMDYSTQVSTKQLLDITDYLDQYGSDLVDTVSEEWLKATSVSGRVYAVPTLNGKATSLQIDMRSDILDKYGLIPDLTMAEDYYDDEMQVTLDELDQIFKTVTENETNMYGLYYSASNYKNSLLGTMNVSRLGADDFGVLVGDEGWTVENYFAQDEFYDILGKLREWYQAGYMKGDIATDTENETTYMSAGTLFATFSNSEDGVETQLKSSTGYDWTCFKIKTPLLDTATLTSMTWAVSSATEVPEAAVKFLNLAYTDKDLSNLMCYGVEGTHWEYAEDGTVKYPDGMDSSNSGYPSSTYWEMPNSLIADSMNGNAPDYNKTLAANNAAAPVSRAMGFTFDDKSVSSQVAACNAVVDEYMPGFASGSLDLESNYSAFLEKLEAAGINDIIAEKQAQLDQWCEENNIEK